ncbi:hypothetical protein H6785_01005 [Candidatus Nomurabacteria bacterium]|nr:hypothetical protein [Candidatus Nomurabacteria bacterium]
MNYNLFGSIEQSMSSLWFEVIHYLPQLVVAVLVLVLGWIIGGLLSGVVRKVFKTLRLDDALDKAGVDELSRRSGHDFKPTHFVGDLVKWFVIIAFAIVAFDILGLQAVTTFMREVVLGYLPNVFAAVLILFAAVLIAGVAQKTLVAALRASGSNRVEFFGKVTYSLVIAFGILAVLNQLKIADELVQTLFMGIVFALSLGAGLAFGLGGRDAAGRLIDEMTRK